MKELGLEIINKINDYGYIAYIIGGYPRDYLLNIETSDIDIATSATPMELKNIFPDIKIVNDKYGSVILNYHNYRFDIMTFRKESDYLDNRHPSKVVYVNDLEEDLLRRDFTINTICIDKDGNIIDLLNAKEDLDNRIIKTIVDSNTSFSRDALRILRAIRFASFLNFNLSDDVSDAIIKNKGLLKKISYERKKQELDKIFASNKAKEGIELIEKYQLDEVLELSNINRIKDYSDIIGIWSMINPSKYHFSSSERDLIKKVNIVYDMDNLDNYTLYKYGLYVNVLAGINKGIEKKDILKKYESLKIEKRDDINITTKDICNILKRKPDYLISEIYNDLERKILDNKLINKKSEIEIYLLDTYSNRKDKDE